MAEPSRHPLVVVLGTRTEVGKTWVTARVAAELVARGEHVEVRKPLQSFDPAELEPTDAEVLATATGEPIATVGDPAWSFPVAMAPPMAAAALGRAIPSTAAVLEAMTWNGDGVHIIETVGGVRSPMTLNDDSAGFTHALGPTHAVLVADAGLGVIDSVRSALTNLGSVIPIVFLNHFEENDPLHVANLSWLSEVDGLDPIVDTAELAGILAGSSPDT